MHEFGTLWLTMAQSPSAVPSVRIANRVICSGAASCHDTTWLAPTWLPVPMRTVPSIPACPQNHRAELVEAGIILPPGGARDARANPPEVRAIQYMALLIGPGRSPPYTSSYIASDEPEPKSASKAAAAVSSPK